MKKTIELCKVRPGETFTLDGIDFVKLDEDMGQAFVLTRDVALKNVPFEDDDADREDHNNFCGSWIEQAMATWLSDEHAPIFDAAVERDIDLTTMDGTTGYPPVRTKVGLLTLDEYRKYRKFIPLVSDWWPLATPWSQLPDYADRADYVNTDGTLGSNNVYTAIFAPRPALHLKSSIFVSVEGEDEEQTPEQREMALYEAAVEKFGTHAQILMAVEEMSELTKALLKYIRHEDFGQGNEEDVLQSIAEERADVSIMLCQLDVIFGDNSEMECRKLEHLEGLVADV